MLVDIKHLPPNLAALGLKRRGSPVSADIMTVWESPYQVITPYQLCCNELRTRPFGGGTVEKQGPIQPGVITSGYRDAVLEDNANSAHMYALALDIHVGSLAKQIEWARVCSQHFMRVGLYPDDTIIHVDQMPQDWIKKYHKTRYWVATLDGGTKHTYTGCVTLADAVDIALSYVGDN